MPLVTHCLVLHVFVLHMNGINSIYSSMVAHGFVLGYFKLHLHYLLLSQQMAAGVLELDLGTGLLKAV